MPLPGSVNFSFLEPYDEALVRVAALAERYFPDDPVTCVGKLRRFGELLARETAARLGLYEAEEAQADLLSRLRREGLPYDVIDIFHHLRKIGNRALHEDVGSHADALQALKLARAVGLWFHRTFGGDPEYKAGPFVPPAVPPDPTQELHAELDQLRANLDASLTAAERAELRALEAEAARVTAEERALQEAKERKFGEDYAAEAEAKAAPHWNAIQAFALELSPAQRFERRAAVEKAARG